MSPAWKFVVIAAGPVLKTVARPVPLRMYSHSSALGCQCISRMPPGLIVTCAAAIVFRNKEVGAVGNPHRPALCLAVWRHTTEPKHEGVWRLAGHRRNLRFDGWQRRCGNIALINPS